MEQILHDLKPLIIISSIVYAVIGLAIFGLALWVMERITPFSIRKEIEGDQNVALAILIGSIFIALAIIIQAAIT